MNLKTTMHKTMKQSLTTLTACLLLCAHVFAAAAEDGKHLFILSGQSNMKRLDPAISFTPTVEASLGKENVIVVKDAEGGKPIVRWYKAWKPAKEGMPAKGIFGDLYDRLMVSVNAAIQGKHIKTVTFVWMQSESDALKGQAAVYEASLKGLIEQLRTDMKRKDINFVIGRITDYQMENADWVTLRKAQVAATEADPSGAWVDTDDLNDMKNKKGEIINDIHFSADGYRLLGERFAQKAIELVKKQTDLD
ncbi:MAG: sialate O-acetylesterase [Verrucomicrobiales bacterium]